MDVTERDYADGRLTPRGEMTAAEIAHWTAAIHTNPDPQLPVPTPNLSVFRRLLRMFAAFGGALRPTSWSFAAT